MNRRQSQLTRTHTYACTLAYDFHVAENVKKIKETADDLYMSLHLLMHIRAYVCTYVTHQGTLSQRTIVHPRDQLQSSQACRVWQKTLALCNRTMPQNEH